MENWCASADILNATFFSDNFYFKQPQILKIHQAMFFWLKKFKGDVKIVL